MNLTKKTVKTEVETTETVCEITREEFSELGAKIAADTIMNAIGKDADVDDLLAGVAMTALLAEFAARLEMKLFGDTDNDKNPETKEEK